MPTFLAAPLRRGLIPMIALGAHVLVLMLLFAPRTHADRTPSIATMSVSMLALEAEAPKAAPTQPPKPSTQTPATRTMQTRPQPQREAVISVPSSAAASAELVTSAPQPPAPAESSAAAPNGEPAPPSAPRFDADYLQNPRPEYPALSRRLGEQGRVVLRVRVEANGSAGLVELHRSSGFSRLDEAALQAVRRWKFVPARRGNEAVAESVLVPIPFILH
ncbi:TonB family protein [Niveibacterium sp. 24ML]|uniref:energy transducer TonB n=1 Tax=Niveibacterium sp. 24ML TaxID=2985512 RepID=UPI0022721BDC|nr:energy transducer TonB [Niveibacterium sp. 24ML]MCX9157371.1 TonB family protein [Niveibacterium sp. 24ML]